jgi:formate dehydrogenase subunit beta
LNTQGNPLDTVNRFVKAVWQGAHLDILILPPDGKKEARVLETPDELENINPFQPLMLENMARLVPQVMKKHPAARVGVLLRPCEMRALDEVIKRGAVQADDLVTICVDCLGTFPEDEFEWRSARKGSEANLTHEALKFAPQGGIAAYRFRAACQMCISPGANDADVNIGVLGLPVRQTILVKVKNGLLDWPAITNGRADPALVAERETMVAKLVERYGQTRERVMAGLSEVLPPDVEALLDQFEACGSCQLCMDNCPICAVNFPREEGGRFNREDIAGWLVSCAGCGMCEQACSSQLPLATIFSLIREQLEEELHYSPGTDWDTPLPI